MKLVYVIGGIASGKSTFIAEELGLQIPLFDLDNYTHWLAKGDEEKQLKCIGQAIDLMSKDVMRHIFGKDGDLIVTGVGNYDVIRKRFEYAKEFGYQTEIVFIDVPLSIQKANLQKRIAKGGRGKFVSEEKLEGTANRARTTFDKFMAEDLDCVDGYLKIGN